MKKLLMLCAAGLALSGCINGQQYLIAKRNGENYELVFSKKAFAAVFDSRVGPYLDPGSGESYSFDDMRIDDPEPLNQSSHAYLEVRAVSRSEIITVGVTLVKDIMNEQVSQLYITDITASGYVTPDQAAAEAGWKCTSARSECGGCKRVRENGAVVGCPCLSGDGYCNFETTGGGGGNWPSWLTSIILALLRFV